MNVKIDDLRRRLVRDAPYRDLVIRCAGTFFNLALAVFNAVLAQMQHSLWNHAMAGYFAVLTIMGSIVAVCVRHSERISARRILAINGVCFIALAIALGVLMGVCVGQRERVRLPEVAMILMAAFTFGTTVVAVIDATKIHNGTTLQQVVARVSIASSIGALLVLEIQMLGTFGDPAGQLAFIIEVISGAVAVSLVLLMGGSLLRRAGAIEP